MDFTKPWLRGKRVVPRKGDQPPRLESIIKTVPMVDEEGKKIVPKVVHGVPKKTDPWIKPDDKDPDKTE